MARMTSPRRRPASRAQGLSCASSTMETPSVCSCRPMACPPGMSLSGSAASAVPARSTSASRTAANCLKIRFIFSSSRVFLAVNMARKSKKRLRKSRRNSLVKKCDRPRCRTLQTRPDRFYPVRIEISNKKRDQTHPIPPSMLRRDIPQFASIVYDMRRKKARIFCNFGHYFYDCSKYCFSACSFAA